MTGHDAVSSPEPDGVSPDDQTAPRISALHASPERVVLTEEGNTDGWLATDTAVALDAVE